MSFWVYALVSEKQPRIYVGLTKDIKRRLAEHNSGKVTSTKAYMPWKLFYKEEVETRIIARQREKFLKGGSGKEFLKKILAP